MSKPASPDAILQYWHAVEFFNPYSLDDRKRQTRQAKRQERTVTSEDLANHRVPEFAGRRHTLYLLPFDLSESTQACAELFPPRNEVERVRDAEMAAEGESCFARLSVSVSGEPDFASMSFSTLPWATGIVKSHNLEALDAVQFERETLALRGLLAENWADFDDLDAEFLQDLTTELRHWARFSPSSEAVIWIDVSDEKPDEIERVSRDANTHEQEQGGAVPESDDEHGDEGDEADGAEVDDLPILNSFFFHDLKRVRQGGFAQSAATTLGRYLVGSDDNKLDLDTDEGMQDILETMRPEDFNAGRWPSESGYFQSLMQQYALQKMRALKEGSVISVNGPPGTGKTTLLRDLIADNVVRRASRLAELDTPKQGLSGEIHQVRLGAKDYEVPGLHAGLTGFEMLVASSNNGAVENISLELPQREAVAKCYQSDADYFRTVATKYAGTRPMSFWSKPEKPVWALVSAALGKWSNRKRFCDGVFAYCAKTPSARPGQKRMKKDRVDIEAWDACGAKDYWRFRETERVQLPSFVTAKAAFLAANEAYREYVDRLALLRTAWTSCLTEWRRMEDSLGEIGIDWPLDGGCAFARASAQLAERIGVLHGQLRKQREQLGPPCLHWLARVFRREEAAAMDGTVTLTNDFRNLRRSVRRVSLALGQLGDINGWDGGELASERNQLQTFWQGENYNTLRSELLLTALDLHRAFVLDAADPKVMFAIGDLLSNRVARGEPLPIWQWLFIWVPVLSTTFASVYNQFRGVKSGSLGWLIVDEAGQAVPQAAVGAIDRAKRVVVVGDPLQIEPVVTAPTRLLDAFGRHWLKDQFVFYGPHCQSVQTLADRTHRYGVVHPGDDNRFIGIPLVVHHRCSSPMFEISNEIAYGNRMIDGKSGEGSAHPVFGSSSWFDISGPAIPGKYVERQGEFVLRALASVYVSEQRSNGQDRKLPHLYVVTPFRDVKNGLVTLLKEDVAWRQVLPGDIRPPLGTSKWCIEEGHVGTVHTFQGKQASTVFLVLGCDGTHRGAIRWASHAPNLLNVAVTRAKDHFYIVGSRQLWAEARNFRTASRRLDDGDVGIVERALGNMCAHG